LILSRKFVETVIAIFVAKVMALSCELCPPNPRCEVRALPAQIARDSAPRWEKEGENTTAYLFVRFQHSQNTKKLDWDKTIL
jgi:hypothetical protein